MQISFNNKTKHFRCYVFNTTVDVKENVLTEVEFLSFSCKKI